MRTFFNGHDPEMDMIQNFMVHSDPEKRSLVKGDRGEGEERRSMSEAEREWVL